MLFESSSEFVVKKLGLGSRLEFISRWDVSGSSKKGLNTFCLRSSGSKFASKLKSNSAKKKSVSSSKWLNGNRVARQTEQNQSSLVLDKALYSSHVKGVHFKCVQFWHMSHKMALWLLRMLNLHTVHGYLIGIGLLLLLLKLMLCQY